MDILPPFLVSYNDHGEVRCGVVFVSIEIPSKLISAQARLTEPSSSEPSH